MIYAKVVNLIPEVSDFKTKSTTMSDELGGYGPLRPMSSPTLPPTEKPLVTEWLEFGAKAAGIIVPISFGLGWVVGTWWRRNIENRRQWREKKWKEEQEEMNNNWETESKNGDSAFWKRGSDEMHVPGWRKRARDMVGRRLHARDFEI
jgi:hypothetical protein